MGRSRVKKRQVYCIDTSSLIEAWERRYPRESFPSFWTKLEALIEAGQLISSQEVLAEIEKKADDLHAWSKQFSAIFLELSEEVQQTVADLLSRHERMVDSSKGKSAGDPWVVATAKVNGATVVTEEGRGPRKIPDVCAAEGVECLNILGLIRREGWTF